MQKKLLAAGVALASVVLVQNANAIPVGVQNASGQYTGITGLDIGGSLYDVTFKDGTFASALGGFDFTTEAGAAAASTSIFSALATVAGLSGLGADPNLAFGCNDSISLLACFITTPFEQNSDGIAVVQMRNGRESQNVQDGNNFTFWGPSQTTTNFVTTDGSGYLWADWTPQVVGPGPTPVPEPGTLALLAAGALLLGRARQRRQG